MPPPSNIDPRTVEGFGAEWSQFDQSALSDEERQSMYDDYFDIFPWAQLPADAEGFDLGCGTGRWALLVSERVGKLHCIDASERALNVARRNLVDRANVELHHASVDTIPLPDDSVDFGYSLGVLHHVPDTAAALRQCVSKLKPGAPFLVYLYYALDNRPWWFRTLWQASDRARHAIYRLPEPVRRRVTDGIAVSVYWPLARASAVGERLGLPVEGMPLNWYRAKSLYTMRTDARDRFGTALEQRFTRDEIARMMTDAGLGDLTFSEHAPFWCAVGYRRS